MKLCKNCNHFRENPDKFHMRSACARFGVRDLVHGLETLVSAFEQRYPSFDTDGVCGNEARFWEPKS